MTHNHTKVTTTITYLDSNGVLTAHVNEFTTIRTSKIAERVDETTTSDIEYIRDTIGGTVIDVATTTKHVRQTVSNR